MRKLTAILFSDIVGFSKRMSEDEAETLKIIELNNWLHKKVVKQFSGKIVKTMGDGFLCTFSSSVDAVLASVQLQRAIKKIERYELRIGIHVGDVVYTQEKDVFGDGVNIAARIESNAPAPGIWVSERVAADLGNHDFITLISVGLFRFKNIPNPMEVFEVRVSDQQELGVNPLNLPLPGSRRTLFKWVAAFATISLLILAGWLVAPRFQQLNFGAHQPDSLVVLPLEFVSANQAYEYLATGFTQDLTGVLHEHRRLIKVMSHATAIKVSESSDPLSQLDVDYIIEGSIHYLDERIKVSLRLLDTDSEQTLWAESFEGGVNDIFDIQNTAALRIRTTLENLRKANGRS